MKDDIANSPEAKKAYIEAFVDKIYDNSKLSALFTESRSQFKQYALDMFLYTNLSYEQIDESFFKLIDERNKIYISEKRKSDICELVEGYYIKYQDILSFSLEEYKKLCLDRYLDTNMSIEEIDNAIAEEIKKKKELLDELKEKDLDKDAEKLDNEEKGEVQEIETEKKPDGEEEKAEEEKIENIPKTESETKKEEKGINKSYIAMAGLIGVGAAAKVGSMGKDKTKRKMAGLVGGTGAVKEEENGPTILNPVNVNPPKTSIVLGEPIAKAHDTIQPQKTSSELNTMLADKPAPIEVTPVNAMEKPAQLIKTNNNKNNSVNSSAQSGSVSLFGIGIAVLSIIAFILVAMILNLLLK